MGNALSPAMVLGSDLDIWKPPLWPPEHTDTDGKVQAYKEGGRFQNPWMNGRPSVASFFFSWFTGPDESNIPGPTELNETLPVKPPVWLSDPVFSLSKARLTWLGHATVLAEIDGAAILTDPVFSARASAVQFAGPKRYTAAACKVKDLPPLDAVLVSHNHYDHLDLRSVSRLAELQPNISWFVPEGMAQWLKDNTVVSSEKVHEMTWWQEQQLEGTNIKIVFTPANHWCKRSVSDDNHMLWGSFAVIGPTKKFWFGGDTGYISWFVPEGMAQWLKDNTVVSTEKVHEMTWWQEKQLEGTNIKIVFTPANHWCKRSVSDDNHMLWGSFAVIGPTKKFWFGGDTGYCEAFKQIGEKYGPFDLAAIPIGAYQPNWFMKYQHVHPGEAVEIHKDIASKKSVGIHWGTFKLTTENYLEPPALLNTFLNKSGLESSVFVATDIGGSVEG